MTANVPTYDLDELKDDVGIAGDAQDAWLNRRVKGVWSRFERYTMRYLGPLASFQDQWQPVPPEANVVGFHRTRRSVAFYLRHFPVTAITAALDDGRTVDPAAVLFSSRSGALDGYGSRAAPTRFTLPTVTYNAGFQEIPADLYEALTNVLRGLWATRSMDVSGLTVGGMVPKTLNITDVGSMDLGTVGTGFDASMSAKAGYSDPYIGPYTYLLDPYVDLRAGIGSSLMPTTSAGEIVDPDDDVTFIGPTPPVGATAGQKWWNSTDGREYILYDDGNSAQWVQADIGT